MAGVWGGIRCWEEKRQGGEREDQTGSASEPGLGGREVGREDGRVEKEEVGEDREEGER